MDILAVHKPQNYGCRADMGATRHDFWVVPFQACQRSNRQAHMLMDAEGRIAGDDAIKDAFAHFKLDLAVAT
ncbi:hypothetical protein VSR17_22885 [Cupriavidus taiwanensis]|uniref:hypothetical protein n=1 Tax=Cupriavidus taiwanensis TaxID=164546 RepID=UPI000E20C71B|nr:hypothetical protein [Cupriavidus taiwanensis]